MKPKEYWEEIESEILRFVPPKGHAIGSFLLLQAVDALGKKQYPPDDLRLAYWNLVHHGTINRVPNGIELP